MIAPLQELGLEQRIIIIIICASIADAVDMSADRTFTANYHQLLHQRPKPLGGVLLTGQAWPRRTQALLLLLPHAARILAGILLRSGVLQMAHSPA